MNKKKNLNRTKIQKHLKSAIEDAIKNGIANCYDSSSGTHTSIDFNELGFSKQLAKLYASAFVNRYIAASHRGIETYRSCLRVISEYHKINNIKKTTDINSERIVHFVDWLSNRKNEDGHDCSQKYKSDMYQLFKRIILLVNASDIKLFTALKWPASPFPGINKAYKSKKTKEKTEYDIIYNALIEDIKEEFSKLEYGNKFLAGSKEADNDLENVLTIISRNKNAVLDSSFISSNSKYRSELNLIAKIGGKKLAYSYLFPSLKLSSCVYLLILISTGANPEPLHNATFESLAPVTLSKTRYGVQLQKRRSGAYTFHAIDSLGKDSPKKILFQYIKYIKYSIFYKKDLTDLFQFFSTKTKNRVSKPALASIRKEVRDWGKSHDLDPFKLSDWRPFQITDEFNKNRNLADAQKYAQHKNTDTTLKYIDSESLQHSINTSLIYISEALSSHYKPVFSGNIIAKDKLKKTDTAVTYALNCKNPLAGIAPSSVKGELCPGYMRCFTCPNAIVTINAETAARLIQLSDHIEAGKATLDSERWDLLYAPILTLIKDQILINFTPNAIDKGIAMIEDLEPLPRIT